VGRSRVQAIGELAESLALSLLEDHKLVLVARNFRSRFGEIDLVMRDGASLVFVEVRCRQPGNPVDALQSIGPQKRRRIALTAAWFLASHREFRDAVVRFDVAALDGSPADAGAVRWIRDAFRPGN